MSADKAIKKSGQKLLGIPIIVQASEAEKNRIAEQNSTVKYGNRCITLSCAHQLF
jgi:hypothetical protein